MRCVLTNEPDTSNHHCFPCFSCSNTSTTVQVCFQHMTLFMNNSGISLDPKKRNSRRKRNLKVCVAYLLTFSFRIVCYLGHWNFNPISMRFPNNTRFPFLLCFKLKIFYFRSGIQQYGVCLVCFQSCMDL